MKRGFTLIELVVVIALIAILSVTLGPKVLASINQAKVSKVLNNLSNLRIQLSNFQVENGRSVDFNNDIGGGFDNVFQKEGQPLIPTYASSSLEENSEVYSERTNEGGWVYFEDTEELYANLPNSVYTGKENEIWNGEGTIDNGGGEGTNPEIPTDPNEPVVPTDANGWNDFIDQDNVVKEGDRILGEPWGHYGEITFDQGGNGNTITPTIWNNYGWEKVYLYNDNGNLIGTYDYGKAIDLENSNNDNDYKVVLSRKDSNGDLVYVYSDYK